MSQNHSIKFRFVSALIVILMLTSSFGLVGANPADSGPLSHITLYSDVAGETTADVPGNPGVHFESFDRIYGSPNGNWIFTADTDKPSGTDEVIMVNDVAKIFEGDPGPWTGGTENTGTLDTKVGINDNGDWVFATNTDGATNDDYIVLVSPADVYTYTAREGDPAPQVGAGVTWDDILDSPVIASDGTVGWSGDGIDGVPATTEDDVLVFGASLLGQEGVTMPGGQLGAEFWDNFDISDYFVSADGTHWIAQGDLTGSTTTDDVAVVDGTVVVQEGVILPGSGYADPVDTSGIVGVWMAPNGDWFVRGNNDITEQDWVYSNGSVIAERGAPIFAGATEVYSDTNFGDLFFLHVGDSFGNYVIGGVTDNPDPEADGVLVVNNQTVVVRQGDPIDLDNNGVFDDDAFFDTFGNDDAFLDDAGNLYFVATIMDSVFNQYGQGVFVIDLSSILNPNTPPTIMNIVATSPIDENDSTTLTGDINDADNDPMELVVNWGDGSVITYSYPAGTMAFTETHQYLDDDPTATPTDMYGVTMALDDGSGQPATAAISVTVNNVSPVASVMANPTTVEVNNPVDFTGTFTDVGTLDTHTFNWGFGDGNVASGTLTPSHTYTATGDYLVLLSVEDDDLGVGTAAITVTVTNPPPTDVSLSSFGNNPESQGTMLWVLPMLTLFIVALVYISRRFTLTR